MKAALLIKKKEVGSCQISSDFLIWRRKSYLEIMI